MEFTDDEEENLAPEKEEQPGPSRKRNSRQVLAECAERNLALAEENVQLKKRKLDILDRVAKSVEEDRCSIS